MYKRQAAGEEDGDALVADIAAAVRRANGNAVWRQKGLDMLTYIEDARIQAELIVEEGLGNAYNSGMEEGLAKGMEQGLSLIHIYPMEPMTKIDRFPCIISKWFAARMRRSIFVMGSIGWCSMLRLGRPWQKGLYACLLYTSRCV